MTQWRTHTPQYDGHAPDDWVEGMQWDCAPSLDSAFKRQDERPRWFKDVCYRYRPLQDATHEPDLLAQCLALPQDQRDALIEAMQKPQRDWADDVAEQLWHISSGPFNVATRDMSAVIRSMCRPKPDLTDAEIEKIYWRMIGCQNPSVAFSIFREALS